MQLSDATFAVTVENFTSSVVGHQIHAFEDGNFLLLEPKNKMFIIIRTRRNIILLCIIERIYRYIYRSPGGTN
jgi:hypothetical protein